MSGGGRVRSYLHAALLDEWDGLDRIHRDLRLADLFTLGNALMGFGALVAATTGAPGSIRLAIQMVLAGVILDGVDGAVARLGKGNGPLGAVLDTLADALTFITTSAVIAYLHLSAGAGFLSWGTLVVVLPLAFYMVCGLLRLARFEALRDDGKRRLYFSGIPSPAAAATLLSLVLVRVSDGILLAAALYLGVLMVSRIRFPKLRGWSAAATVAILLAVLVTFRNEPLQAALTWGLLAFMALYVVAGPFYVLAREGPEASEANAPEGT